jgi:hypothetical protein
VASKGTARGSLARLRPAVGTAAAIVALLAATFAGIARAEHVAPIVVPGNPTCADQGYLLGLRIDPVSGTYVIPGTDGQTVTVQTDGTYLDWSSSSGLDAVMAKGSPDANLYRYDPRSTGDTGLHAPINPVTGLPYELSHVDFCLGIAAPPPPELQLQVSKTAGTSYTRTFGWQLTKNVDDASHSGVAGASFASTYTVEVDKTTSESAFAVAGQITIHNPTGVTATITGISDSAGGTPGQVNCGLPHDLAPGATLVCPYTASLESKTNGTNSVTVQTSGLVGGASATADYAFGEPTTVVGDASVVVTDTDPAGPRDIAVSDDRTFTYGKGFACSTNAGDYAGGRRVVTYLNTVAATGPATNLSAAKTVELDCLLPGVAPGQGPADMSVAITPNTVSAPVGSDVVFTVTITNRGGSPVGNVTAHGSISLVSIESLTPNQGTCSQTAGSFTCALGTLEGGASATIRILARILSGGNVLASASASGDNQAETGASTVVLAIGGLPKPQLGVSVNLIPVSGAVYVNGKLLKEGINIGVGAKVDTRKGKVILQSFHGTARFKDGLFQVRERRVRRGVTELVLLGGNFTRGCGHPARALSQAGGVQTHEKKVVRRLWGNGKGSFRTTGQYSSATVRGTIYLTADRCDGTLTKVVRGRVVVADFALEKNVVLGPGQSYLARPPALHR